jgi:hypothetical protein
MKHFGGREATKGEPRRTGIRLISIDVVMARDALCVSPVMWMFHSFAPVMLKKHFG